MDSADIVAQYIRYFWPYDAVGLGETLWRMFWATIFGLAIGFDRELKRKAIGMRAFMLISVGACGYAILTLILLRAPDFGGTIDPSRLIQGILGAFGFLGAGAIIQARGNVSGFASAAAIWMSGAVGIACGMGHIPLAFVLTLFAIVILVASEFAQHRSDTLKEREPALDASGDD